MPHNNNNTMSYELHVNFHNQLYIISHIMYIYIDMMNVMIKYYNIIYIIIYTKGIVTRILGPSLSTMRYDVVCSKTLYNYNAEL